MAQYQDATARQLGFPYDDPDSRRRAEAAPGAPPRPRPGPRPLCAVCGRVPAQLTLDLARRRLPARVCLRCHHSVMRQRRMLRATLGGHGHDHDKATGPVRVEGVGATGLIVPRQSGLSGDRKYRRLAQSRRRAQKAARHALEDPVLP